MPIENFRWLAGLVAAHPDGRVVGRTRLQKELKLLQRVGFPTDYSYTIHFYGPYSEGVQADIGLLDAFGFVDETPKTTEDGKPYYVLHAKAGSSLAEVENFRPQIDLLASASPLSLELAATYDAFREAGADHAEALSRLRGKKASKCNALSERQAFELLQSLGLPHA